MNTDGLIINSAYFFLGVLAVILGRYWPSHYLIPRKLKDVIMNEKGYVKDIRVLIYVFGLYCILLAMILIFIEIEPIYTIFLKTMILPVFFLRLLFIRKKYIHLLKEKGNES